MALPSSRLTLEDPLEDIKFIFDNKDGTFSVHHRKMRFDENGVAIGLIEIVPQSNGALLAKMMRDRQEQIDKFERENGILEQNVLKSEIDKYGKNNGSGSKSTKY